MQSLETWLGARGYILAQTLDRQRDIICEQVTRKLATSYPDLCPNLPAEDPELSQQMMFQQTPHRFHTMLLAALRFGTLAIIEREYRWLWGIVQRFWRRAFSLTATGAVVLRSRKVLRFAFARRSRLAQRARISH